MTEPLSDKSNAAPEPGTREYVRAVYVLFSGAYDHLTTTEARVLVQSTEPLNTAPMSREGSTT